MTEAARQKQVEYHNPRPLILGICFFWGVAMGFGLYFFREPEARIEPDQPKTQIAAAQPAATQSELERRRQDTPNIAVVEPAGGPAPRPTIEDIEVGPPATLLTTEGGLTGRTAQPLGRRAPASRATPGLRPPAPATPPPLPELMP